MNIYTMDFETDPFHFGVIVKPFACGLYDGSDFTSVWGPNCADSMVKILAKKPAGIVYMHNGGKFDIFFLLKHLNPKMVVINGRIVECSIGAHTFRDSYAILPIPLRAYKKDDIDIAKLESSVREENKREILDYLRGDCVYLHELVTSFRDEFGDYLTIGSAAMKQLQKFHPVERAPKQLDDLIRKEYFFGGRVECFQSGLIKTPFKIYDVNSMYPHVMKSVLHPIDIGCEVSKWIDQKTQFIRVEGQQIGPYGVFPFREKAGLTFKKEYGIFHITIHEWIAAEENGWFKAHKIHKTYGFETLVCFDEFVDHFFSARQRTKKSGEVAKNLFYKLILNSAYGKFAQNPDNFMDWQITRGDQKLNSTEGWREHTFHDINDGYTIWSKPTIRKKGCYYNVAVGASITGAARAVLIRALKNTENAIYCDTDSIICREVRANLSEIELGAWKLEATGDRVAIAGKKLYAAFNGDECVKKATKGARISESEIVEVARGGTAIYRRDSPTFKLDGRVTFIERKIRKTV